MWSKSPNPVQTRTVRASLQAVEDITDLLKMPELLSLVVSDLELFRGLHDLKALADSQSPLETSHSEARSRDFDATSYRVDVQAIVQDKEQLKKHKLSGIRDLDRLYIDDFSRPIDEFNDGAKAKYEELQTHFQHSIELFGQAQETFYKELGLNQPDEDT